jgi:DNA-binding CsgD family transcriptional regulator
MRPKTPTAERPERHSPISLLERGREIASLEDVLDRVARGAGSVLAIEGEPGIGKTELLAAAGDMARERSMSVHLARGSEHERSFGYGVVRELAESIARRANGGIGPPGAGDSARDLVDLLDPANDDPPADLLVARGVLELAAAVGSERPLLLAVDDLHWADLPSLRVLLYIGRRIAELPVLLCVATRSAGRQDPASPLIDAVLTEAGDLVLHPAPLSADGVRQIVTQALGEGAQPAFSEACREATGGNPLLLRELLRGLATKGIEPSAREVGSILGVGVRAVSRTVRMRLTHLPEPATRLARAAAALGDGAPLAQAARVAGLDEETAFDAGAGLGQLEILTGGSRAVFVHPLVREAVLSELTAAEAASLHESAAAMLTELDAAPERIAEHLLHSPPRGSVERSRILRHAANAAATRGDPLAAAQLLARALQEPASDSDHVPILLELAAAEWFIDINAATAHVRDALNRIDDPQARAAAAVQLADLLPAIDPHRTIEIAEPHVEALADPEARRRARAVMLTAAVLHPDLLPVARELAAGLRPEMSAGTPAARMATGVIGYLDALESRPAREVVAEIEGAITAPLDPPQILGQLCAGVIALVAADSPAALSVSESWNALSDETGFAGQATAALMTRSHTLLARGRLAEAVADAREGVAVSEAYIGGAPVNWTAAALVEGLIELGELDEAERVANRILPTATPRWTLDLHGLLGSKARLAALRGDRRAALDRTLELGRRCDAIGVRNPALAPWRSRAALLIAESSDGEHLALGLAEEEVELARIWGAPRALGRALTALALVGPPEDAIAHHTAAVDVLDPSPARLELARATLELGAALRRAGRRTAARGRLRRAVELAEECGAVPLLARAREELVATGARPRRSATSGPDSLTPQERRVATIAAEGLSNQEIAARLYLAPRTVESHLSNAYRKLGISSRSQLARALSP